MGLENTPPLTNANCGTPYPVGTTAGLTLLMASRWGVKPELLLLDEAPTKKITVRANPETPKKAPTRSSPPAHSTRDSFHVDKLKTHDHWMVTPLNAASSAQLGERVL